MTNELVVVVDMQNDFLDGALANKAALDLVPKMAQMIKQEEAAGSIVLFTLDTHNAYYLETQEGKNLPVMHCIVGTEGHRVHKDLLAASTEKYRVEKPTFGMTTELWKETLYKYFYKLNEVKKVSLVGTVTSICVLNNALALKALLPEVEIVVYEDLCADLNDEMQQATLKCLQASQVKVEKYFKD
ncbi:MAG: cysteine hydrolase [Methanobrevibacter sp.]|nr:cysteine hydrolase [Methanobrevibacter sp.]